MTRYAMYAPKHGRGFRRSEAVCSTCLTRPDVDTRRLYYLDGDEKTPCRYCGERALLLQGASR